MKLAPILALLAATATQAQAPAVPPAPVVGAQQRSQMRIRDPFVLPDPATQTYYIYSSTTHDGGHPMLFRAFDGRLLMAIHQPNRRVERARFFEIEDSGDSVRLLREVTGVRPSL